MLTGPGGSGKSTLLANWIQRFRASQLSSDRVLYYRFVGAGRHSGDVPSLLRHLLLQMKEDGAPVADDVPEDPEKLRQVWSRALESVTQGRKTVIVIDALNQPQSGLSDLFWLPSEQPGKLKFIVSLKGDDEASARVCQRMRSSPHVRLSGVRPFRDLEDRRRLVRGYGRRHPPHGKQRPRRGRGHTRRQPIWSACRGTSPSLQTSSCRFGALGLARRPAAARSRCAPGVPRGGRVCGVAALPARLPECGGIAFCSRGGGGRNAANARRCFAPTSAGSWGR